MIGHFCSPAMSAARGGDCSHCCPVLIISVTSKQRRGANGIPHTFLISSVRRLPAVTSILLRLRLPSGTRPVTDRSLSILDILMKNGFFSADEHYQRTSGQTTLVNELCFLQLIKTFFLFII